MKTNPIAPDYKGDRFPPEIISHSAWPSFRFFSTTALTVGIFLQVGQEPWVLATAIILIVHTRKVRTATFVQQVVPHR